MRNTNTRKKLPIRINVVILVGLGYFTPARYVYRYGMGRHDC